MKKLISVCIPTYGRSVYLQTAVRSVLEQEHRPLEILVGDDSPNEENHAFIASLPRDEGVSVRYLPNQVRLGQAGNVNRLLKASRGDWVVILHDDDFLLPGALGRLFDAVQKHPDAIAAFGLQAMVDQDGTFDWKASTTSNRDFERTAEAAGAQPSRLASAVSGQFPNNAFLLKGEIARQVLYDAYGEVKDACDYDFGIRVALSPAVGTFVLIDDYVSAYRVWGAQISKDSSTGIAALRILNALQPRTPEETRRRPARHRPARADSPERACPRQAPACLPQAAVLVVILGKPEAVPGALPHHADRFPRHGADPENPAAILIQSNNLKPAGAFHAERIFPHSAHRDRSPGNDLSARRHSPLRGLGGARVFSLRAASLLADFGADQRDPVQIRSARRPDDCDIVLVEFGAGSILRRTRADPEAEAQPAQVRVFMHHTDHSSADQRRLATLYAEKFDLVLSAHRSVDQTLPANVKPWALGLAQRQIRELTNVPPFAPRERTLRYNFRHIGKTQSVRQAAQDVFYPISDAALPATFSAMGTPEEAYHNMMWKQTGRRHTPVFYEELMSVTATSSFCGWFIPSWPHDQSSPLFVLLWRLMRRFDSRAAALRCGTAGASGKRWRRAASASMPISTSTGWRCRSSRPTGNTISASTSTARRTRWTGSSRSRKCWSGYHSRAAPSR